MSTKQLKLTKARAKWAAQRAAPPMFTGTPLLTPAAAGRKYAKRVAWLTAKMVAEVNTEVLALFHSDTAQAYFGQDAAGDSSGSIASQSRILVNGLQAKFAALFAKNAKPLAEGMLGDVDRASTTSLHSSLQKLSGGFSLKTSIDDPRISTIYKAAVAENVSLIKSIASQYLEKVNGQVMRSITSGNGLQDLVPALQEYEGQTHRRARNIALDQTRKAYNSINKGRMQALGVQKFKWLHSGGGAHPREDHVAMSGSVYAFNDLPVIDQRTGEVGIPGQAPNCRCTMSPVFEFAPEDEEPEDEEQEETQ